MAARIRQQHQDEVRARIQASQLVNRVQGHALGEIDMTATQLKAAEMLLNKTIPNLQAIQHSGDEGGPLTLQIVKYADTSAS